MGKRVPQLTFGDRLRLARETAGIGSAEMADLLHVVRHTITSYERGRHQPSYATVQQWAEITGVDLTWLMTGKESEPEATVDDMELLRRAVLALLSSTDDAGKPRRLPASIAAA